jgi:hypothetical protein
MGSATRTLTILLEKASATERLASGKIGRMALVYHANIGRKAEKWLRRQTLTKAKGREIPQGLAW